MHLRCLVAVLLALPAFGQVAGDPLLSPLAETDLIDFGCTAKSGTTPEFDAAVANCWEMTLSASVTASTLVNELPGRTLIWKLTQPPAGGSTFAWPSEVTGACTIASGADAVTVVSAIVDGSGVRVTSCATVGGPDAWTFEEEAPASVPTPAANFGTLFLSSSTGELSIKKDSGSVVSLEAVGGGSLIVEEADDSPTVGSVTTIQFDQADGFSVTDETGGQVQVDWTPQANQITLTTHTVGNYAAGDAEAGAALSGDSATAFFPSGTIEAARLPTTLQTAQFCYSLFDTATAIPDAADVPSVWMNRARAITITEVRCETDAGTPSINLQRDDGTPANILSANLTCTTGGANGTIDAAEDNVATAQSIDHVTVSGSTAKRINVCVTYTID